MIKSILSGSFGFNDPVAQIVPAHSRSGVDPRWLAKRAASSPIDFSGIESKPDETLVHMIAVGDGETYGPNRNGDYFPKAANQKYHRTFLNGHYFHNHQNHDPALAFGRVAASGYNEPMGRIELVVGLNNQKCAEDLHDLSTNGEFPVSMSCFRDPNTLILTARGYIAISRVRVGDYVLTHTGAWKRVTEVMQRRYTGDLFELFVRGVAQILSVTADHPLLSFGLVRSAAEGSDDPACVHCDWVHASHLSTSSRLTGVLRKPFGDVEPIDVESAGGLGYVLARRDYYTGAPDSLFGSSENARLAFLGAWLDVRGAVVGQRGVKFRAHDEVAALDLRDLLLSVGIVANVRWYNIGNSWTVYVRAGSAGPLSGWSWMVRDNGLVSRSRPDYRDVAIDCESGVPHYSIQRVVHVHVDDEVVYNLEVEDDHSYSAYGIVSHNCRVPYDICYICGNKAKSRAQYCKHASQQMCQLMEDGRVACVINDRPDYFDISRVWRNADRVAFTLQKLEKAAASGSNIGGAELAELLDATDGRTKLSMFAREKRAVLSQFREMMKGSTPLTGLGIDDLPDELLSDLRTCKRDDALFGALHGSGVCLSRESFFKLAGIASSGVADNEVRSAVHRILSGEDESRDDKLVRNGAYDGEADAPISSKAAAAIWAARELDSVLAADARSKLIRKTASAAKPRLVKLASTCSQRAEILADEYAAYLLSFARRVGIYGGPAAQNLTALRAVV